MGSPSSESSREAWGVLGGTFDPPHLGHFRLALAARDALGLERVLWVPAFRPPHKRPGELSPYPLRVAMAEMTARRERRFDVSRIEEAIPGASYTVRTLAHLARALPDKELHFIVGADVLPELRDWFRPERISRWATVACGVRPGYERPDPATLPVKRIVYFDSPAVDVSSTQIRERVRSGESLRGLVSPDVEAFIRDRGLYRSPGAPHA